MTTQPVTREASASRHARIPWSRVAAGFLHGVVAVNCASWCAAVLQGASFGAVRVATVPVALLGAFGAYACVRASLDAFRTDRPMTAIVQDIAWTAAVTVAGFYALIALQTWQLR